MSHKLRNVYFDNKKGFVFSLEATLALTLFGLMLFTLPQIQMTSLKELAISQQENDLLRILSAKESSENEISLDAQELFGQNAEVWINEKQILFAQKKKNAIASAGIILDPELNEKQVKIVVYYD